MKLVIKVNTDNVWLVLKKINLLKKFCNFYFLNFFKLNNLCLSNYKKVFFKTSVFSDQVKKNRIALIRSPHVFKKSKERFYLSYHRVFLTVIADKSVSIIFQKIIFTFFFKTLCSFFFGNVSIFVFFSYYGKIIL